MDEKHIWISSAFLMHVSGVARSYSSPIFVFAEVLIMYFELFIVGILKPFKKSVFGDRSYKDVGLSLPLQKAYMLQYHLQPPSGGLHETSSLYHVTPADGMIQAPCSIQR